MSVQLVAAVAVEPVAVAALLAPRGIRVDDLGDALVAAEEVRHVGREIDEHVPAPGAGRLIDSDLHGLERRVFELASNDETWNEAALRERPEELVELLRLLRGGRVDVH